MKKRHAMAVLSLLCVVGIWALGMPRGLLILALIVAAILLLNAIFHVVD